MKDLSAAADLAADTLPAAPPRMLILRGKSLLARHCDRIQDRIEESLADLRAKMKAGEPIRVPAPVPCAPAADSNPH